MNTANIANVRENENHVKMHKCVKVKAVAPIQNYIEENKEVLDAFLKIVDFYFESNPTKIKKTFTIPNSSDVFYEAFKRLFYKEHPNDFMERALLSKGKVIIYKEEYFLRLWSWY